MVNYDMTMSDLMMKIGSQLWLVIMLILVLWSGETSAFPANSVRKLLTGTAVTASIGSSATNAAAAAAAATAASK